MKEKEVIELLSRDGAIITDSHFVLTSGKHAAIYVNKDAIYPHTAHISKLCRLIAEHFMYHVVEAVIAPAIGGVILSQWTAHHLTQLDCCERLAIYAEKDGADKFSIKRGYDKLIAGRRVLVVEDVLTTGGSARKVIEAARAIGCNIVGLGVLCNRGGVTAQDVGDVPELFALSNIKVDTWDEAECPLCVQGIIINTDVGKGREYLARTRLMGSDLM